MKKLWQAIRPVKKRFYQYGTIGLSIKDDRTLIEKICDHIDKLVDNHQNRNYNKVKQIWHTYFDVGIGDYITSYSQIKKIEKEKGWAYLTQREIHDEAKKGFEDKKKKSEERTRKKFEQAVNDLHQGRSFVKEMKERINKGNYQIGQVSAFNGR